MARYRDVGSYEPDYNPHDDPIVWRHITGGMARGYARCADSGKPRPNIGRPNYVYVASSWRNTTQPIVVQALRNMGIDCYDFKDEEGFHWSETGMASYDRGTNGPVKMEEYLPALRHPRALQGFNRDHAAMVKADACVMVLPCGNSAHLELGWMAGQNKRTIIYIPMSEVVPDLMYLEADRIVTSMAELIEEFS